MNPTPWLATQGSALPTLAVVAGFLALSLALGRRLTKLCDASVQGTRAERIVIGACLGAGVLQFVPFALGIAGLFNLTALRIAALVVGLLALPDLFAVARSGVLALRTWQRPDDWVVAWILALAPAALMAIMIALAPSLDPDGLAYHLTVPKRWMTSGHFAYLPTYPYSNAPMGMELLFGWAMAIAGDSAAKCIHLSLGLFAVATIYLAGKRLRGPMTGAVAATLFFVGPAGAVAILGFAYVDGGAAFATAAATLAWLLWFQTNSRGFLRLAALLAGIAVSFKISAALFPIGLGALTVLALHQRLGEASVPHSLVRSLQATAALIPFAAAPVILWLARAFLVTGNPFFPMLANRIPSRDLSPVLASKVDDYNRYMLWGNAFGRDWSIEQRTHILLAVALILLIIGAVACFRLHSRVARGAAAIITITALAQLSAAGLYLRYSLPLSAPILVALVAPFERRLARRPAMLGWVAITLLCSLLQARRSFLEEGSNLSGLVATLAGVQNRTAFLRERLLPYPIYERINQELPPNAAILLSGYCSGFYIDRTTFCAEMVQDSLRFTTWEEFTADLRRLMITHVIAPSVLATGGPTPPLGGASVSVITRAAQFRLVRQLLTEHAHTLQTTSDLGLYEIDPGWLENREIASHP